MTRKLVEKTLLVISLLGTSFVSANAGDTNSLFAIEGGVSSLRASTNMVGYEIQKSNMNHFGLKLGAEGENYRVFLSGRNFIADTNNKLVTLGVEGQYKFNFSKPVSFFMGLNGGTAYIEIGKDGLSPGTNLTTPYFGGDLGLNYHASKLIDLEVGAKYMFIDNTVAQGAATYTFRDLTSFYSSIIFKWKMD